MEEKERDEKEQWAGREKEMESRAGSTERRSRPIAGFGPNRRGA